MKLPMTAALVAALALAACTSSPGPSRGERVRIAERALGRARVIAEPGKVVAADIALARAALDEGQWTAFRRFAAPGAQLDEGRGPADAATVLATRADPPQPLRWAVREVWSSCDGTLAASFGRWRDAGIVGNYLTIWQRQGDGSYRWLYRSGSTDNPQPLPPPAPAPPDPDTIVVTELESITARAADCEAAAGLPMDGLAAMPGNSRSGGGAAGDGTLRWRWEQHAEGTRRIVVDWIRDSAWQEAVELSAPSQG